LHLSKGCLAAFPAEGAEKRNLRQAIFICLQSAGEKVSAKLLLLLSFGVAMELSGLARISRFGDEFQ
jgi:hypothetical protein